jgi:hypothetical protein
MKNGEPHSLPVAIRVYPQPEQPAKAERRTKRAKRWQCPEATLVFDTETRIDETQALTFGSYRCIISGRCVKEGIFYAEDLPETDRRVLEQYVAAHRAEKLHLMTRSQFVDEIFHKAYKGRWLLVAFSFPFDISRVAIDATNARGRFSGGFSLGLWDYIDEAGNEQREYHRPAICIKHIDSKRALKGFTSRRKPDQVDLIPEGSKSGEPEEGYIFRGNFLDLRTLAFALTDKGHSLESACKAFGVEHGKEHSACHGVVTEEYIDYNRRDVSATSELAVKLLEEYAKHPINLQVTKAYSPASIGKAYLRAMGIKPIMTRQPKFPKEYLGYAATAFFGGRASAHIRKVPVPVVYTDFLSMYPTVNSLMDLWRFVTARKIKVVEHCQAEIEIFLKKLIGSEFSQLFNQETWKELTAFVQIIPDGDILPSRAKYSQESNDWQVAVNHVYARNMESKDCALWYSLPDIVASVLLTGRMPKIVDAFRIEPCGTVPGLKPTKLLGVVDIEPRKQDFFKVVIEERMRFSSRTDITETEKERLKKAFKILANAASYGIYAEMNRQESDEKVVTTCHGIDAEPFKCLVQHPDVPGEYCFPPLASLITGAARLMLALLENCIREFGGTCAMEDTDSMAIVATENGGLVPCPGGLYKTANRREAVKALSWEQVRQISHRFAALKPYDHDAVPGSILKIEDDNFDPKTKQRRQIYCFAISAKRYALFLFDENGAPVLLRENINNKENQWSDHGLGHLLNPIDPENRDWTSRVWLNIIRKALKLPTERLAFEDLPAVGRLAVGSPGAMKPLGYLNIGKKYRDQIKPFNFLLTCHVKQLGHPIDSDPERFHLIAPYQSNPKKWLGMQWIDQYSGRCFRVVTTGYPNERTALVKTYGDVLREYEFHPESKCADAGGNACDKQTVGLLKRLHVRILKTTYIGKESNKIEDVAAALVHSAQEVYTEYPDPRRDEWESAIRPALNKVEPERVAEMTGLAVRTIIYARTGTKRPRVKNQERIAAAVRDLSNQGHV